jgi:predicted kinase
LFLRPLNRLRCRAGVGNLRAPVTRSVRVCIAMSEARLILTCGLPGAGKTTLARQLAADRGAVCLTKDEWLWALGSTPWDALTQEKVEHALWQLAQDILRLGLSVVLDFGLWARIERDEMRAVARGLGVGVELHYRDEPADELCRRIDARNSQPPWDSHPIRRTDLDGWIRLFHAPDAAELALFDSPPDSR